MVYQIAGSPIGCYFYLAPTYYNEKAKDPAADVKEIALDIKHSSPEVQENDDPNSLINHECALCDNPLSFPATKFKYLINNVSDTVSSALQTLKIKHLACGHLACSNCHALDPKECKPCQSRTWNELTINIDSQSLNSIQVTYKKEGPFIKRNKSKCLDCCQGCGAVLVIMGIVYGLFRGMGMTPS